MSRINVYHHEIPFMAARHEVVKRHVDTGNTFYGIRFYTEPVREHEPGDDDSSAITLWVPWSRATGHDLRQLRRIAHAIESHCDAIEAVTPASLS